MPLRMKDIDSMDIEKIIHLSFFHSLEKSFPDAKLLETVPMWKIVFKCNKMAANGVWQLLDQFFECEFVVRYKLIDFNQKMT